MYEDLAAVGGAKEDETAFALEFEEPALATLGFAYQERGRLSGGAYHAILRKADGWLPGRLADALPVRRERAALLLAYDEAVTEAVAALKARGFNSPYLRNFVVARTNPLRFIKGEPPPLEELLPSMTKRARGMDANKSRPRTSRVRAARPKALNRGPNEDRFRAVIFDLDGTLADSLLDFDAIRAEIGLAPGLPILEQLADATPAERARAEEIMRRHERTAIAGATLTDGCANLLGHLTTRGRSPSES